LSVSRKFKDEIFLMNGCMVDLAQHREHLINTFGERFQENVSLARYTAARVGGPAEVLLVVDSAAQLAEAALLLWRLELPFVVLGGGSNVLVSDSGVRGIVVLNRAKVVQFNLQTDQPYVLAESGANLGLVARQAAARGLAGLEWCAGIPGTVGGAVIGNAGAHGGDMSGSLRVAEILHLSCLARSGSWEELKERWKVEKLDYSYRTSTLKHQKGQAVVLAAELNLENLQAEQASELQAKMDAFQAYRRRTQPPGASMGSMFKNPPDDYAGRLIEAAGLKGTRSGDAEISTLHANFFVNHGSAAAADIFKLLRLARQNVSEKLGIDLELEIELLGEWNE
jgi:UDP-N-acetylmuramate dehydrogenase